MLAVLSELCEVLTAPFGSLEGERPTGEVVKDLVSFDLLDSVVYPPED